jgi:hypothetical protein
MDENRVITPEMHGVTDYAAAGLLMLAPQIFGFEEEGGAAVAIPRMVGAMILAQSLMTNYKVGVFKVLPFRTHLALDYPTSLFLAASPFLFGFANRKPNAWVPHVVAGLGAFTISMLTMPEEPKPKTIPQRVARTVRKKVLDKVLS